VTPLATDLTQRGDRFQARITEPTEFSGAILEGRVTEVKRPGKVKGVAQLQLRFEQIRFADNSTAEFHADIVEVVPTRNGNDVSVDSEGGIRGRDSTKDDVTKVGAASGIGAIIGGIAGGGHGAAIGAVIGGGVGTAGTMTQRGKDIRLDRGQVLKIKTSTDTGALASK
jgi:type IV secretion system protein VirB10